MINDLIQKYVSESSQSRMKMQSKLFELFTETTGYRPDDICLVERQIKKGDMEYETIFYFDTKSKYQYAEPTEASRTPHKWPTFDEFYKFAKLALTKQQCEAIYDWFESFVEKEQTK